MMRHVIVGNGPCGLIAAETICRQDPQAQVVLIGDEGRTPYGRMALPYWIGMQTDEKGCHLRRDFEALTTRGIRCVHQRVSAIVPSERTIHTQQGQHFGYDRLLLATGSTPKTPALVQGLNEDSRIGSCWTQADARKLMEQTQPGATIAVLGAGFIACTLLPALLARKLNIVIIEAAPRMLPRMMDEKGAALLQSWCEQKGMKVHCSARLKAVEQKPDRKLKLRFDDASMDLVADFLLTATGVQPNVEVAHTAGIQTDQGIVVDAYLRTNVADVFAAGDCSQGPSLLNDETTVSAIQPTACDHGRIAGLNMSGIPTRYGGSLDMNVLNTAGLISSSFGLWQGIEGSQQCTLLRPESFQYLRLCLSEDTLIGAIVIGMTQHVGVARSLIASRTRLGSWAQTLLKQPQMLMHAWLDTHQPARKLKIAAPA